MKVVLNNGTVIDDGSVGLSDGFLWLFMPGYTMQDAAAVAFNPEAVRRIIWQAGDDEYVYTGYTVCTNIGAEDGRIAVCLVKG